jgi:hypothetical protein
MRPGLTLAALAALVSRAAAVGVDAKGLTLESKFKSCSTAESDAVEIKKVAISPLVPGEPVTVTVSGVPHIDVPDQDIEAQVKTNRAAC